MKKDAQMEEARQLGDKTKKPFFLSKDRIENKIENIGYCLASDRILVDGCPVGYMYREEPDDEYDSGWRFLSGDETQKYADDQWNFGLYSVNTVCNYDPEITPFVGMPIGSAIAREFSAAPLIPIDSVLERSDPHSSPN